jgi:hypothetical protein
LLEGKLKSFIREGAALLVSEDSILELAELPEN